MAAAFIAFIPAAFLATFIIARTFLSHLNGLPGHFILSHRAMPGDFFHLMAIPVARRKIHAGIHVCGIGAQRLLYHTHDFDKLAPVGRAQETQAAYCVAD